MKSSNTRRTHENSQFGKFVDAVKKYEYIKTDDLWILLSRYIVNLGRGLWHQNRSPSLAAQTRARYYKYWIKKAEGMGLIEQTSNPVLWKVNQLPD